MIPYLRDQSLVAQIERVIDGALQTKTMPRDVGASLIADGPKTALHK